VRGLPAAARGGSVGRLSGWGSVRERTFTAWAGWNAIAMRFAWTRFARWRGRARDRGVYGGDEEEGRECIWTNSTFLSFILFIFVSAFHRFPTAVWSGADEHLTPFNHTMRRLHSGSSHNTPTCCQRHATTCHFAESDWVVDVQLLRYCILTRALT
jgi:hypothetical protein